MVTDHKVFPLSKTPENSRDLLSHLYLTLNSETPTYNKPEDSKIVKSKAKYTGFSRFCAISPSFFPF